MQCGRRSPCHRRHLPALRRTAGHGALDGAILSCPYHGWQFDCRTGTMPGRRFELLETYPVKVEDGEIFVELP